MPSRAQEKYVNEIPNGYAFKAECGRTGWRGKLKKRDADIDRIAAALDQYAGFRALGTEQAITRLRAVRRTCYRFTEMLFWQGEPTELPVIKRLLVKLTKRLDRLTWNRVSMVQNLGAPNPQRPRTKAANLQHLDEANQFYSFYNQAITNAGGVGRSLDAHYGLERASSSHIPKDIVGKWMEADTILTLKDWSETMMIYDMEDKGKSAAQIAVETKKRDQGVTYLDARGRDVYRVTIRGGLAYDSVDDPFHTGGMHSHSGAGWGIYVMDFQNRFYFGQHEIHKFHHSSFFAGLPVKAAGEIRVDHGRIVGITNKTGHYKAGTGELNGALMALRTYGVDMNALKVCDPFRNQDQWFSGTEALNANGDLSDLGAGTQPRPALLAA